MTVQTPRAKQEPLLTVCVPAYNQREFLRDALGSVCDQGLERHHYRVAIADDASPDSLKGVVDEFRDRLDIDYYRHRANVGHLRNFQHAFSMATTPFVSFLPHDDVVAPGQLGRALATIRAERQCVLVPSLVLCEPHPGALQPHVHGMFLHGAARARFGELYRWELSEWMAIALIGTPLSIVGAIFRADAFSRCREWLSFPLWHDRLMLAEMGLHGDIVSLPWIGGYYRESPSQLSGKLWQGHRKEFVEASRAILRWCDSDSIPAGDVWVNQICAAGPADRVTYLQLLSAALPAAEFRAIKTACEKRLNVKLHASRLDRLRVPRPVAAAMRNLNQFLKRLG